MTFEELATLMLFATAAVLFLAERIRPGRKLPKVSLWPLRGFAVSGATFLLAGFLPLLWDAHLAPHRLLDARALGHVGGAIVGALLLELVNYWWHRALHRSDLLWRWFHQMHHSAERIDLPSALYSSPLDTFGWSLLASLMLVLIIGVTPEAAIAANASLFILNVFSHTNLRTPRWLGYLVARPELHSLHHQRGAHSHNYSVIPLWDILFGTFRNPRTFEGDTGFYDGASVRIPEMLIGRDVTTPRPSEHAATQEA